MKKNKDFKTKKNNKVITLKKTDTLAKCLAITLLLSKEEYEQLSADAKKRLFGDWKQEEIDYLHKIYEDGIGGEKC
mgnify:CR=1 FL=1